MTSPFVFKKNQNTVEDIVPRAHPSIETWKNWENCQNCQKLSESNLPKLWKTAKAIGQPSKCWNKKKVTYCKNSMKTLRHFYFPFLTLGSRVVLNALAYIPMVGPWTLVLEGAKKTLFSKNVCLLWPIRLPEGLTEGTLLCFIDLDLT